MVYTFIEYYSNIANVTTDFWNQVLSFAIIAAMKPYSHYCLPTVKTAGSPFDLSDADVGHALKYTGLGSGLGAGGGLISALLLESLKNPEEAQYLRRALQGAGIGALAGGGLGGALGLRLGNAPRSSGGGGHMDMALPYY